MSLEDRSAERRRRMVARTSTALGRVASKAAKAAPGSTGSTSTPSSRSRAGSTTRATRRTRACCGSFASAGVAKSSHSGLTPGQVRKATTLGQVAQLYLEDLRERAESGAKCGKRSGYASAKNRLERHILAKLGAVRVRDVTTDQVRRLHRAMKETPVEANRKPSDRHPTPSLKPSVRPWA
jgi:hypothetical protein